MGEVVDTTCPYCGVGCGVRIESDANGARRLRGVPDHPANLGRLCSKGSALLETIDLEGRLLYPQSHGRRVSWDGALDQVATGFSRAIAEHGPDSVAFYVSGQLLTEDYYVANKLMKGFIGSANIDTNSRLCMASAVAGHRRAFGADIVPVQYEDLELADLIVLVGSNLAWCHPVLYQRIAAAKEKRPAMKIVLIDPRRTMTADIADLHLPIKADGDVSLFNGLLAWLMQADAIDRSYLAAHTLGFHEALIAANATGLTQISEITGLPRDGLTRFYDLFAKTEKAVTIFSQGVNQSSSGTDKVDAIINCHLATGRIGKPGAGPFSITGQPNAMGGREVGGLANMLAAHMEIENGAHRDLARRFWRAPRVVEKAGLKAVDLFRAVADGRIKALWIMATNPVDSMPDANLVETALKTCPLVIVSDVLAETDTVRHAHITLPAAAWGEKDGTVTNSERRISRQRAFLAPPGEARPDWRIICDVAARMGFADAFSFDSPAAIFAEHAALSGFENDGSRAFDIGALAGMGKDDYDRMEPMLWPCTKGVSASRVFGQGRYFTPERKARLLAIRPSNEIRTSNDLPLVLNTGRVRDHWHTLTRTGKSARLSQHMAEPFAEIHPEDASHYGIRDASIMRVSAAEESILVRALITARQKRGTIFVPMHWTDQFASRARVDTLVPGIADPHSGQPALKHVPVNVASFAAEAYGFAVLRERPAYLDAEYWAIAKCEAGWRVELAFSAAPRDWAAFAAALFGYGQGGTLSYHDGSARLTRFACFSEQSLVGALFLGPEPVAVSRNWAVEQLKAGFADRRSRLALIAGRPGRGVSDPGATVCSCFGVGANQIALAVRGGCSTVEAIGQTLQAGTNCGSCRAEIKVLIDTHRAHAAE